MIDRIAALFRADRAPDEDDKHGTDELQLAAAALLVEAAAMDETFDAAERRKILALIERRFTVTPEEAAALIELAEAEIADSAHLYRFTRVVNDQFSPEERIELIEMLWEVAYADGHVHAYESNLLRRIAGLIYVSDRDSGLARQRVRARQEQA